MIEDRNRQVEALQAEVQRDRAREEEYRTRVEEELRLLKQALASERSKTERMKRELSTLMPKKSRTLDKFLLDSVLITNQTVKAYISENLPGYDQVETALLYRGSRDGWMNGNFHIKCDNKGPTIVLIKSTKGRVSGGYTSESWETPPGNKWKQDQTAFLFSCEL
jgi:TLD